MRGCLDRTVFLFTDIYFIAKLYEPLLAALFNEGIDMTHLLKIARLEDIEKNNIH